MAALKSIDFGVASSALPGEAVSGDRWVVKPFPHGVLLSVVDGLGHGPKAAEAAKAAIAILNLHPQEPMPDLFKRCHEALLGTRGAVISLITIDTQTDTLTRAGVGNIETILIHSKSPGHLSKEWVLLRGGVVGFEMPVIRPSTASIEPGDLIIFATDGIRSGFAQALPLEKTTQQIADSILADYSRGTDDALVLAVRYRGETT